MAVAVHVAFLCGVLGLVGAATELYRNADLDAATDWRCADCHMQLSTDKFHGSHSLKITNRYTQ